METIPSNRLIEQRCVQQHTAAKAKSVDRGVADMVYSNVSKHRVFITNLGKCTQVDARPLPDSIYLEYLKLLRQEINIVRPTVYYPVGNGMINMSKAAEGLSYILSTMK